MEKFHNSPPVDPVVSITAPEIKKRLGSWVRTSISVLVIGGMATTFAADEDSSDETVLSEEELIAELSVNQENRSEGTVTSESEMEKLLGLTGSVQILAWIPYTDRSREYPNSVAAIHRYFKDFTITESLTTDPSTLKAELVGKDVFLVPELERAGSNITSIGSSFSSVLEEFVKNGGTVIDLCDYRNFLHSTGLMKERHYTYVWANMKNVLPSHPLTKGLGPLVKPENATLTYKIDNSDAEFPVIDQGHGNEPSVISINIGSGHVVLIGYDYFNYNDDAAKLIANAVQLRGGAVAGPGKFEFSSKIYFANENSKNAIVKVARKGGSTGVVSVNYATAAFEDRDTVDPTNNPAAEGEDYATTEGSLTWKDGESGIQTFKVPLFNDSDEEGDETVNLVLSSPTGATLGDKDKISAKLRIADDECHGVYTTAARTLYHPLITVPVFDPISGQATEDVQVFEGTFTLLHGTEDFKIDVTDQEQFNFIKQIKNVDKLKADCYAKYDWQTETFQIPYVDVPSIVVLPMGQSRVGPTQIFRAKMQQMPLSGEYGIGNYLFHVEGAPFQDASITADANASVKTESKDEVEAEVDASIEIAPDELTYYQYLYTYDK